MSNYENSSTCFCHLSQDLCISHSSFHTLSCQTSSYNIESCDPPTLSSALRHAPSVCGKPNLLQQSQPASQPSQPAQPVDRLPPVATAVVSTMSLPAGQQTTYSRRDRSSEVTDELASSRVTTPVQQQMYSEETTPTQASHDALYANVHIGRHTDRHDAAVHMYYNPPYNSDEWAFVNQLEEIDAHRLLLHRGAATAAIPQYASASDYVPQTKVE